MGITEVRFAAQPVHVAAPKSHARTLLAPLFGSNDNTVVQCSRSSKQANTFLQSPAAHGSRLSIKA